jgi:hypothetical protein
VRGSGPRVVRDALGPVLAFYAGWKLVGLGAGITAATALALAAFAWERRHARSGLGATIGLALALLQAVTGLASGSAVGYFAPAVVVNALYGTAFFVSVAIGRPLAGIFAQETYPFPLELRASPLFRRVFSRISLAWGAYLVVRSAVRLATLLGASLEVFVLVNVVSGVPVSAALMAWSLWYGLRSFKRLETPAGR